MLTHCHPADMAMGSDEGMDFEDEFFFKQKKLGKVMLVIETWKDRRTSSAPFRMPFTLGGG